MLSHSQIKYINSLKIKKYRQEHQAFIVEGEKSVAELKQGILQVITVYALESWIRDHGTSFGSKGADIREISQAELEKISDLTTPNKVLAVVKIPAAGILRAEVYEDLVLALDSIRDPGNMGTIIRTADWFGIRNIICSEDCVDVYNPKVIQATMGSYVRVNLYYTDLRDTLSMLPKGTPVYGALLEGEPLNEKTFSKPGIIIIGNESRGISPSLLPYISDPVFIPPFLQGKAISGQAESLNASVANAIICYEIRKQLSDLNI